MCSLQGGTSHCITWLPPSCLVCRKWQGAFMRVFVSSQTFNLFKRRYQSLALTWLLLLLHVPTVAVESIPSLSRSVIVRQWMVNLYICNLTDRMKKRRLDRARLRFYYIWDPIAVVLWLWVVQVLDIESWLEYRATVSAISSYHAVNTLLLSYKNQAINAV